MHKATYHENELLDMAQATENRAVRLRKAIEHNRLVREQSRAGSVPEPDDRRCSSCAHEPQPTQFCEAGECYPPNHEEGVCGKWEPAPETDTGCPTTITLTEAPAGSGKFAAITSITAAWDDGRACLRVVGDGNSMTHVFTTTPLADIRKQAAEAGIELPEVTVNIDSYRWTAIERADCHVCDDGSLLTGIIGVAERYGEHTIHTSTLTPAQVLALCALAGWPKPEVRMVLTYADGSACEVDPCEDIVVEYDARWHATSIAWVPSPRDDGYEDADEDHIVREPVAVVEQMLADCGDPVPAVAGE